MVIFLVVSTDAGDGFREPSMNMRVVVISMMQHHIHMPVAHGNPHLMLAADRRH